MLSFGALAAASYLLAFGGPFFRANLTGPPVVRLDNGLEVVIEPDTTAPVAHVELLYRFGARNDPDGKRGLAHLVERLLARQNRPLLARVGATEQEAMTDSESTLFSVTVPSDQLELALWVESGRMGSLFDSPTLGRAIASEREAIARERLREVATGGDITTALTLEAIYGVGDPRANPPLGVDNDLGTVTAADVKAFGETYHRPNQAILVVTGDVDPKTGYALIEKYFGGLPNDAKENTAPTASADPRSEEQTRAARLAPSPSSIDRKADIDRTRVVVAWPIWNHDPDDDQRLDLLAHVLAGDPASRLHRRLIEDQRIAHRVAARYLPNREGGRFEIELMLAPGQTSADAIGLVIAETVRLRRQSLPDDEIDRALRQQRATTIHAQETVAGRGRLIARSRLYGNDPPSIYQPPIDRPKAEALRDVADRCLKDDQRRTVTIDPVHPTGRATTARRSVRGKP